MEEIKYQGNFIKVTELELDGQVWEKAYFFDSIVVFPITDNNEVIMVLEKRPHEINKTRLKFITGHIDSGENAIETAYREMQEEAGFKADKLEQLMLHESSGSINSKFHFILATGISESKLPNPDGEDTILEVKKIPLTELKRMLYEDEFPWTLSTLGIFKIFQMYNI